MPKINGVLVEEKMSNEEAKKRIDQWSALPTPVGEEQWEAWWVQTKLIFGIGSGVN